MPREVGVQGALIFGGDGAFRGLKPIIGGMVNADGGFMSYAGLAAPFQFDNGRIGVAWTHISNANIHDQNPGVNSVLVTWTWMFRD